MQVHNMIRDKLKDWPSGVKLIPCYNLEITLGHLPHLAPLHKLVSLAHLPEGLKYGMAAGARIFLPWATFDLIGHRLILMTVPGQKALDHNTFLHGVCHGGYAGSDLHCWELYWFLTFPWNRPWDWRLLLFTLKIVDDPDQNLTITILYIIIYINSL